MDIIAKIPFSCCIVTGDGSTSTIFKAERKQGHIDKRMIAPDKHISSKFRYKTLFITRSPSSLSIRSSNSASRNNAHASKTIDLKRAPEYFKEELRNEIEALKSLDHSNMIRANETCEKRMIYH